MTRALSLVLLLSCLSLLFGCTEDLSSPGEVKNLRILAIRANSPMLAVGQRTELDALVVDVAGADISLSWEVCPFTRGSSEDFACDYPDGTPASLKAELSGSGDTFAFVYSDALAGYVQSVCSQSVELSDLLPEGITLSNCSPGVDMEVRLVARSSAGEERIATKSLTLLPPITKPGPPIQLNHNPRIASLDFEGGESVSSEAKLVRCDIDAAFIETTHSNPKATPKEEFTEIAWYARDATLKRERSAYQTDYLEPDEAMQNRITPTGEHPTVWCVIVDGRGGVDWAEMAF